MKKQFHVSVVRKATNEVVEYKTTNFEAKAEQLKNELLATGEYGEASEFEVVIEDVSPALIKEIKVQIRRNSRSFCGNILDHVAALNDDLGEAVDMSAMFASPAYQGVILALLTGATLTARNGIASFAGSGVYTAEQVNEIVAMMDDYLAHEKDALLDETDSAEESPNEEV